VSAYSLHAAMLVLCSGGVSCLMLGHATVLHVDTTPAEPEYVINASRQISILQPGWLGAAVCPAALGFAAESCFHLASVCSKCCSMILDCCCMDNAMQRAIVEGFRLSILVPAHLHLMFKELIDLTDIELT
jgi:hypothetical protein